MFVDSTNLTDIDITFLYDLYRFKCLSISQSYRKNYSKIYKSEATFKKNKLSSLINNKVIELINYSNISVVYITNKGINILKEKCDIPINTITEKHVVRKGYYTAPELRIQEKYLNHQLAVNDFIITFEMLLQKSIYAHLPLEYYDERFIDISEFIRPDGLIRINNIDFYIEMDMGTEAYKLLTEKWNNYSKFLKSDLYNCSNNKIIVLFILNGDTQKIKQRKKIIKKSLADSGIINTIDDRFDICVGSNHETLNYILNNSPIREKVNNLESSVFNCLKTKHGFSINKFNKSVLEYFNFVNYDYLIRKTDSNNNTILQDGKLQEYLLSFYYCNSIWTLKKIADLNRNCWKFKESFNRDISYIIVLENHSDMYEMCDDLIIFDLINTKNIYFTTNRRLEEYVFCTSLIKYSAIETSSSYQYLIKTFQDMGLNSCTTYILKKKSTGL